jgi:cell division protein FtsW
MAQLGKLLGITMMAIIAIVALIMITGDDSKEDTRYQMSEQIEQPAEKKSSVSKIFHRMGTWKGRIKTFTSNNDTLPDEYYLIGKGAQAGHANIAIASCNIIGKGPGNSKERDYLPQAFSDFIFSIIIEEMGIEGGIIVVFLYIVLLFRTARIASRCERNFPAMLIMGLALLLVTQAIFNMLVAVGLAPVTGQPLPLISKGGTSTLINCAYIGAILSVSRYAKKKPEEDMDDTSKIIVPKSSDTNYSEEFTK